MMFDVQATHAHKPCSKPQSVTWILLVTITPMTLLWQHITKFIQTGAMQKTDVQIHVTMSITLQIPMRWIINSESKVNLAKIWFPVFLTSVSHIVSFIHIELTNK